MQRFRVAALAVVAAVGMCAGARAGSTDEPMAGETIVVGKGVTETVQQIMAREAALVPEPFRVRETKPEHPALIKRPGGPNGPVVPSWPPGSQPSAPLGQTTLLPQVVGTSFLGARLSESGFVPPDSMGDVGPSQVMVIVNGRIRVFDKTGAVGGLDTTTDNFFAAVGGANGTSDPHVRYDRLSQRWFVSIITVAPCPNDVLLAVSSGPVISSQSSFTFFRFQGESGAFVDYDTLGVDRFALYLGANVFNCNNTFRNTSVWVVNKANLVGNTLTVTAFRNLIDAPPTCVAGIYTPQGVSNDDPQATQGYFIGVDACVFGELVLHRVNNPGGTPTLSARMTLAVPSTTTPIAQVQPGGPALDALDDRLFAAQVQTNALTGARTLWTAHNIEVNAGGGGQSFGGRNGSRWYEIGGLTGTPTLVQAGTLFDPSGAPLGYWIPSVAMSRQGHMALGASRAGGSAPGGFASVAVAGRLRTDPLGLTQSPTLAQGSTTSYSTTLPDPERWGDYSQVGVDPIDGQTMWTFQEYCDATNSWGVRAVQLRAPPPATPATANPSTIGPGLPSVNVVITGTSAAGAEFFDPGADTGGPGFAGRIRATVGPAVTVNSVVFNSPTQVTLNLSTVGATTGAKTVTVTNPDGQSRAGSGILNVTCPVVTVLPASLPGAILGAAYTQTFTQSGGLSPASFAMVGTLPAGMTFSAVTATLSGTPTQSGSFPLTVNVTDGAGCPGSRAYTLVVTCPPLAVNPLTVPTGKINTAYTQTFTGSGATSTLTFSQTGTLPAGLSFNAGTATLAGTATQSGAFIFTVTITDTFACTASRVYNLAIADGAALTPTALAVDATGNGVLETNQTVVVDPSWANQTGGPVDLTGTATSFIGPPGPTYTIVDGSAAYGTVGDGSVVRCSTATGDCYALSITATGRPASHWDASFVESLSTGGPKAWTLHVGGSFTDVPSSSLFYRFVEILLHRGITGGCGAATYCPSNPTTRDAMAVFVLVAKEGAGYVPPACGATPAFNDVPVSSGFCRWIEELARRGVVSGCGGGNYCPGSPVTREQMAIFVLLTLDPTLSPPACTTPVFGDVPASSPFCRWIEELARRGVVSGCGGGNYCPASPVTREQMGVFLSATFGLTLYGP